MRRYELNLYAEYFVVPSVRGAFSERLVDAMHAYWRARPTLQKTDGGYVLCESSGDDGELDSPRDGCQVVSISRDRVLLEVNGNIEQCRQVYRFIRWVERQAPCEVLDVEGGPIDPDYWLALQVGLVQASSARPS